jgi:hypothetical protein
MNKQCNQCKIIKNLDDFRYFLTVKKHSKLCLCCLAQNLRLRHKIVENTDSTPYIFMLFTNNTVAFEQRKFNNVYNPTIVSKYLPYLTHIKNRPSNQLLTDLRLKKCQLEEVINSGVMDDYCRLIPSEMEKIRRKIM